MTKKLFVAVLAAVVAALLVAPGSAHAAGKTFVVTLTGDTPDLNNTDGRCDIDPGTDVFCTLRAAITEANQTKAKDRIEFAIPGDGPHTISSASTLQVMYPVEIDGYTEPGSVPNTEAAPGGINATLMIQLRGPGEAEAADGLRFDETADGSEVSGLAIANFAVGAIVYGDGVRFRGNFIGMNVGGTVADGNSFGVYLSEANEAQIGGIALADRNLISGNFSHGIAVSGNRNTIAGNLIGTKRDATTAAGNGQGGDGAAGIAIVGKKNVVGDTSPSDGTLASNVIANSGASGVIIAFESAGNRVMSNRIFNNDGLGIDLFALSDPPNSITVNDERDRDTGPNRFQNFPRVTSVTTAGRSTTIQGVLDSTPSTASTKRVFIVQFFRTTTPDGSGYGEAEEFIGQVKVATNRKGHAEFTFTPDNPVPVGQYVTATATDKATGDTSEFGISTIADLDI